MQRMTCTKRALAQEGLLACCQSRSPCPKIAHCFAPLMPTVFLHRCPGGESVPATSKINQRITMTHLIANSSSRRLTEWRHLLRTSGGRPFPPLIHTYLGGYMSINSQQVIDPKCRTLAMCFSERSPIRLGGLSSSDCAAKESRPSAL